MQKIIINIPLPLIVIISLSIWEKKPKLALNFYNKIFLLSLNKFNNNFFFQGLPINLNFKKKLHQKNILTYYWYYIIV